MILSFRTDRPGQIVHTQIRLLIRVYTVCPSVCIVWTHYSMVEPHSSNFRVITTNILGVRIFRKFTVELCDNFTDSQTLCTVRNLCMIILAYSGFLRFNELSNIRCKDSYFQDPVKFNIPKSKTDQYRHGCEILINKSSTSACPVNMLVRIHFCLKQ